MRAVTPYKTGDSRVFSALTRWAGHDDEELDRSLELRGSNLRIRLRGIDARVTEHGPPGCEVVVLLQDLHGDPMPEVLPGRVRSTSTWSGMTRCHVEAVRHKTLGPIL